jgi:Tfp pilus assembly protein PilE
MEIQSSSIHIIIAVLVLVSIGFIVYMNYNEITLLKSKVSKALSDISENNRKIEEFTSNYGYSAENLEETDGEELEMDECYNEEQEEVPEETEYQEYNNVEEEVQENSEVIQEETNEPGNLFGDWNTSTPPPVSYVLGRSVSFKIDESPDQEETLEEHEIQEIEEGSNAFGLSPSYSGCQQILKSGKNAGELCEKKVYIGSLCKQHYAKNS